MKRIISLTLAVILVLTNINALAASETGEMNESYYTEAGELLSALGIISGGNGTMTAEPVTRMEILRSVIKILNKGVSPGSTGERPVYNDVSGADQGYIGFAVRYGMLPSVNGSLMPDAEADFDFAKMIMTGAAGYEIQDGAYKKTAIEVGLANKMRGGSTTDFKKGDANVMMYNLITTVEVKRSTGTSYTFDKEPLIKSLYDIDQQKARLVANSETAVDGNLCGDGQIRLEAIPSGTNINLYYDGDTVDLLGRRVRVYYNSDDEAILMYVLDKSDITVEFDGLQYLGYESSSREISWGEYQASNRWESSLKPQDEVVPSDADIIYNGRYTTQHSFVYGILENGNGYNVSDVQLIDSDKNGKIDLMKVEAYKTLVVSAVNQNEHTVKDRVTKETIDFDEENDTKLVVTDKGGNEGAFSIIKENCVISVFETLDNPKKIRLVVCTDVGEGKISAKGEEDNRFFVSVDGMKYMCSNTFAPYRNELLIGSSYTLLLDINGFVSGYVIGVSQDTQIGGVVKIVNIDNSDGRIAIELFNTSGEFKNLETAAKWRVNGKRVSVDKNDRPVYINDSDVTVDVIKELKYGIIQCVSDASGSVKEIITPKKNANKGELGYTSGMNNPEKVLTNPSESILRYKTNFKYFFPDEAGQNCMNFVAINGNTKIIKVPSKNIDSNRHDYYSVASIGEFANDSMHAVLGLTLDGSDGIVSDIAVIISDTASADASTGPIYVVKDICQAVNNSDEIGYKLSCVRNNGAQESFVTKGLEYLEYETNNKLQIEEGDVIRVGFDAYNDAVSFVLIYDCSSGIVKTQNPTYWYGKRLIQGSVYSTSGQCFTYVVGNKIVGDVAGKLEIGVAKSIIRVDLNEDPDKRVVAGQVSDMIGYSENQTEYSRVILMSGYGEMSILVEYK